METVILEEIDSTSLEARRLISSGVSLPLLLISKKQTKGKGRTGRAWESPVGNVYLSLAVDASNVSESFDLLPLHIATIIASWLEVQWSLRVTIKWPNDLLIGGRKIGGILCEALSDGANINQVLIGVGINVKNSPELQEQTTCSLGQYRTDLTSESCIDIATNLGRILQESLESTLSLELYQRYSIEASQLWYDGSRFGMMLPMDSAGELRLKSYDDDSIIALNHTHHKFRWIYQSEEFPTWVADCGNSFIKIACFQDGQIDKIWRLSYQLDQAKSVADEIQSLQPFKGWPIHVGVVADDQKDLIEAILEELGFRAIPLPKRPLKVDFSCYKINELGIDRLALIEGLAYHQDNQTDLYIAISLGTAVTVDILDRHDKYQGGWIMPGLATSLDVLHQKTSRLPSLKLLPEHFDGRVLGHDTEQSMTKGVIWSLILAVQGLKAHFNDQSKKPLNIRVIVTGGDAHSISSLLPCTYDEGLILRGFASMARGGFAR